MIDENLQKDALHQAKRLLRLARTGALATLDQTAPLTTLVGIASDCDGAPLMLLSTLSRHTQNLTHDPRVSLLLTQEGGRGDPLNRPRLTLNGILQQHEGSVPRARYLAHNPKSKLYIDFADFALYRLTIRTVHYNGGFGRAAPLMSAQDLLIPGDTRLLALAETEILAKITALYSLRGMKPVGIDAEGLDLHRGSAPVRIDFPHPALDPDSWWQAFTPILSKIS